VTTDARPGLALRLTALAAALAALIAVISGVSAGGGLHRVLAALALPPLIAIAVSAYAHRRLLLPSLGALASFLVAAAVTPRPLHVGLAALALAATSVLAVACFRGKPLPRGSVRDYVTLTKPRIMSLLLVTGACGMIVGARGWPGTAPFLLTMLGLALACGGASALNHLLDRDIDKLMGSRTEQRPVAAGRLAPARALEFGLALSACSFTLLASTVNVLTAVLALVGNLFYVVVYTGYLKRRGPQNIVLGGAAGAAPRCGSSSSSSCGRRRTSGRLRSCSVTITPRQRCRCFLLFVATGRRFGGSLVTPLRSLPSPPSHSRPAPSA